MNEAMRDDIQPPRARRWTLRGRGPHHAPDIEGPYLPHNEHVVVIAYSDADALLKEMERLP